MTLRLTKTNREALRLALSLAIERESALADACTPVHDHAPFTPEQQATIATCEANVSTFKRLIKELR